MLLHSHSHLSLCVLYDCRTLSNPHAAYYEIEILGIFICNDYDNVLCWQLSPGDFVFAEAFNQYNEIAADLMDSSAHAVTHFTRICLIFCCYCVFFHKTNVN